MAQTAEMGTLPLCVRDSGSGGEKQGQTLVCSFTTSLDEEENHRVTTVGRTPRRSLVQSSPPKKANCGIR